MRDQKVMGIIFANRGDNKIPELTEKRSMASVPFGARYRLIDFVLSGFVDAGIPEVAVITNNNYHSLIDHLGSGREWDLSRKREGLYVLPPFGQNDNTTNQSRLDSLSGITGLLRRTSAEYCILADSDVVGNFQFEPMVERHIQTGADITIAYKEETVDLDASKNMLSLTMDLSGRVTDIMINPHSSGTYNRSLGFIVMEKKLLERMVHNAVSWNYRSFDRDILQSHVSTMKIYGYQMPDFTMRIESMSSYYQTTMRLLDPATMDKLFPRLHPIYNKVRDEVPAIYGLGASVKNSLIADGCVIDGEVENSIIFRGVTVKAGAKVKNSIVMQGSVIGTGSELSYVITDKDVNIQDARMIMGFHSYPVYISKGSVV